MEPTLSPADALAALPQPFDDSSDESLPKPRPIRPTIFPLHPILSSSSTKNNSPMTSPHMSRRSSSAGSCTSGKSVHFPGSVHQLSSFQFTHSRDQYDRSPIIPSCEDLEIPSCKKSGSGAWMRCLQRKAKEASEAGQPPPFISSVFSGGDLNHPPTSESIPAQSDLPALLHDDYSSSSESDDHLSPTVLTPPHLQTEKWAISSSQLSSALLHPSMLEPPRSFCWDSFRIESDVYADDAAADDDTVRKGSRESSPTRELTEEPEELDEDDEFVDSDAEEEGRMGIVGLGKFSRSSLYAEDDLLGGF